MNEHHSTTFCAYFVPYITCSFLVAPYATIFSSALSKPTSACSCVIGTCVFVFTTRSGEMSFCIPQKYLAELEGRWNFPIRPSLALLFTAGCTLAYIAISLRLDLSIWSNLTILSVWTLSLVYSPFIIMKSGILLFFFGFVLLNHSSLGLVEHFENIVMFGYTTMTRRIHLPKHRTPKQFCPSICFMGGGQLWMFAIGVGNYVFENYDISRIKFLASSSGTFAAVPLACGLDPYEWCRRDWGKCMAHFNSRGFVSCLYDTKHFYYDLWNDYLPLDAHIRCTGRLFISVTLFPSMKNKVVSVFKTRNDLIWTIVASICLPYVFIRDFPVLCAPEVGMAIDGGFSNDAPCLDSYTITVSALHNEADIKPVMTHFSPKYDEHSSIPALDSKNNLASHTSHESLPQLETDTAPCAGGDTALEGGGSDDGADWEAEAAADFVDVESLVDGDSSNIDDKGNSSISGESNGSGAGASTSWTPIASTRVLGLSVGATPLFVAGTPDQQMLVKRQQKYQPQPESRSVDRGLGLFFSPMAWLSGIKYDHKKDTTTPQKQGEEEEEEERNTSPVSDPLSTALSFASPCPLVSCGASAAGVAAGSTSSAGCGEHGATPPPLPTTSPIATTTPVLSEEVLAAHERLHSPVVAPLGRSSNPLDQRIMHATATTTTPTTVCGAANGVASGAANGVPSVVATAAMSDISDANSYLSKIETSRAGAGAGAAKVDDPFISARSTTATATTVFRGEITRMDDGTGMHKEGCVDDYAGNNYDHYYNSARFNEAGKEQQRVSFEPAGHGERPGKGRGEKNEEKEQEQEQQRLLLERIRIRAIDIIRTPKYERVWEVGSLGQRAAAQCRDFDRHEWTSILKSPVDVDCE